MKKFLKITGIIIVVIVIAIAAFFFWAKSGVWPNPDKDLSYASKAVPAATHHGDSLIDVVSYNIGYLSGLTNNTPQRPSREFYAKNEKRVLEAIKDLNADIIGFQEIDYDSKRSYRVNQAKMICDAFYPYGSFAVNWNKNYVPFPYWPISVQFGRIVSGQAIVSKFPIAEPKIIQFEKVKSNPFYYNALYLDRLAQIVTINHPLKPFKIINVHTEAFDTITRTKQLQFLYDLFLKMNEEMPTILLGDLNSDPIDPNEGINIFLKDKRLSVAALNRNNPSQSPKTYPSIGPKDRIDYIIVDTTRFDIVNSRILNEFSDISDHLPCWAEIKIK